MKVIKEPVPISWSIEKVCAANVEYDEIGCGAVLEVDISDIYIKNQMKSGWSEIHDCSYTYPVQIFAFRCPCCGKETSIKNNEIPNNIRKVILCADKDKKKEEYKQKKLG